MNRTCTPRLAAALALSTFTLTGAVGGCSKPAAPPPPAPPVAAAPAATPHPLNVIQQHPTMTGVAAGVATHQALKASAANKKATGQPLNFAERHPTLTGIAAGVATHRIVKSTTHAQ